MQVTTTAAAAPSQVFAAQQPMLVYMNANGMMMPVVVNPAQQALYQQQQLALQQQVLLGQCLVQQNVANPCQLLPLVPTATSSTLNSGSSTCGNDKEDLESTVTHDSLESSSKTLAVPVLKSAKPAPALKSTATTPVSGLAGAIAKRIREHGDAEIIALGIDGTNQAVKAMALARTFIVQEGMTLLVSPSATTEEEGGQGNVMFHAEGIPTLTEEDTAEEVTKLDVNIRVSAHSNIRKTAGAIAKLMRGPGQKGSAVGILTMGAESVHVTAQAVTVARTMLEQDALDVYFKPRFIHVEDEVSSQPKPALRLSLYLSHRN